MRNRSHNPNNTYTGFRPRNDQEAAFFCIKRWGEHTQIQKTFSAIINSLLDGINDCMQNTTTTTKDGRVFVEINLGKIEIK